MPLTTARRQRVPAPGTIPPVGLDLERRDRFETLMALVYEPLQRFACRRCERATADDLVADTLLVLWRRLDDIPPGAELAWSYRIAGNCLANARRSGQRRLRLLSRLSAQVPEQPPSQPDPALHAALAHLSPMDQELLRLWGWEQLSPSEIALALDLTPNAVSIRLHRAKRRLAELLAPRKNGPTAGHERQEDQETMP